MPASNNGMGAPSTVVNLGSGSAGSQNMHGRITPQPVSGCQARSHWWHRTDELHQVSSAGAVNLGQNTPPPMPKPGGPAAPTAKRHPRFSSNPSQSTPQRLSSFISKAIVSVRLRVSSSGAVQVLGVTSDLGHGLGDSAIRAVQATRFQPATDASGNPVDWEGVVNVAFQLAG